ncbi:MAG: Gx transporter family protein, partial [Fibrobacter sp.]|nr:Gx transporter family protein [Fibrobacter sp.]
MQLQNNVKTSDEFSRKTTWLLLAIALNALELFLPRIPFLPWLKPGVANVVTIIWIIKYGPADAILYTILRSWISGFYFGFSFITLLLSLSGGILSTTVMGAVWVLLGRRKLIGTVGLGITGAFFHNAAQLIVVYLTLTHNISVFYQLPFMGIASLVFGGIVGLAVPALWTVLNASAPEAQNRFSSLRKPDIFNSIITLSILVFCICLFAISNKFILLACILVVTIVTVCLKKSFRYFFYPLRFWALFFFVFLTYLIIPYGTRLHRLPFLTIESIDAVTLQFMRIWTWLEAGLLLQRFKFHESFFYFLKVFFKNNVSTLESGIAALEYFPMIVSFVKSRKHFAGLDFIRKPLLSMTEYLYRLQQFI